MKILVSVVGRFHAFDLAKQLKKHKSLYKINTTYPKFKVREWGIENNEIRSNIFWELVRRYFRKILPKRSIEKKLFISQSNSNKNLLKKVDIFIGWSGSSLEALKKAKSLGKITILERGSSHYTHQMGILQEEYEIYGKEFYSNTWAWERELQEYQLADFISIPSIFVKRTFIDQGIPENKLFVNPYGVDLSSFKKIEKKDDVFRIITSGNLSIQKGTRYLLEAFDQLNLPNAEVWHLGSINEDMRDWLERYENKNVHFLGHKPQDELYKYYSQGSVFSLMSLQDGFGMVLIQAMACGLPIITSTNTGGLDLITTDGKEGFVLETRDVEGLKKRLTFLYNNPDILNEMSRSAIARVQSGFTWDDYGNRYMKFLEKVYSEHK